MGTGSPIIISGEDDTEVTLKGDPKTAGGSAARGTPVESFANLT